MIDWSIEADSFGNCNCDHWCPCQFEGLPSQYSCEGFEVFHINRGHFGGVDLSGVTAATIYTWPGPIFKGKGTKQNIIDQAANQAQRDAISTILKGGETQQAATHWWVFHKMSETVLEDLVKPISFAVDLENRTATVSIPDLLESTGEPIRSPHSGEPHRVQIRCPEGIEFDTADIGNASTRTMGEIKLKLENTYGQFNKLHQTGNGPAHVQ
jgi:hypothetical protein